MKQLFAIFFLILLIGCAMPSQDTTIDESTVDNSVVEETVEPVQPDMADDIQNDLEEIETLDKELEDTELNAIDQELTDLNW